MIQAWLSFQNGSMRQRHLKTRWVAFPCLAITLSLLATSGCAVHRVRADFTGFEKAYADTSNHELLLNLARLQNHDPTYFFKMGQITSSYRMSATAPTSVGFASQSSVAGKSNTTGGATPGLSYESDPLFQFIPVNDETNAQLLLKQIPAETFYILYQQGWRIDQLFRVMVDRIEVTQPTGNGLKGCSVSIYRNSPPAVGASRIAAPLGLLQQQELSSYAGFLRASAIAYSLQKHGNLVLREVSTFVPLDANALTAATSPSNTADNQGDGAKSTAEPKPASTQNAADSNAESAQPADSKKSGVDATVIEKAAEKGLSYESYELSNGNILIGQRLLSPKFYLIPTASLSQDPQPDMMAAIASELWNDPNLIVLNKEEGHKLSAVNNFLMAVVNGFAIQDDPVTPTEKGGPCPIENPDTIKYPVSARLVLRSLIGVMAAVAQEQIPLDRLVDRDVPVTGLAEEPLPGLGFNEAIPVIERLPILRINWKLDNEFKSTQSSLKRTRALTELDYQDTDYLIADPVPQEVPVPENEYWNRDVFRLIAALTAQVTVDTSKYPIANILQLNSVQ
jgi:hypothetical protein